MRRVITLTLSLLALAAVVAPSAPALGPSPSFRDYAARTYAAFRHPAAKADRIAPGAVTPGLRKRIKHADVRLVGKAATWKAFLALEAGPLDEAELIVIGRRLALDGYPAQHAARDVVQRAKLRDVARNGLGTTFWDGDVRTSIVVVPDGAKDAEYRRDDNGQTNAAEINGNLIVAAPTLAQGDVQWTDRAGKRRASMVFANPDVGTPVTVTLLGDSQVTADLGNGVVRTLPLSGTFKGHIPGGYLLGRDNTILIDSGDATLAPTDVLTDSCAGPALARINPATHLTLDSAKPSQAVVAAVGGVTATMNLVLRSVLDLRQAQNGCGAPAVTGGYADTPLSVTLEGQIQRGTGLANLALSSDPYPMSLQACMAPGPVDAPCAQAPTTVPLTARADVAVGVVIG